MSRVGLRQRLREHRTPRGTAEMSVLVVVSSLVAGLLFGTGLSRTSVDLSDGLTWLADDPSGDVIQVNPRTGRSEYRYDIAGKNQNLEITQYDGRMFVVNHTTGQLTSFDLASLLASGQRSVSSGGALTVLHHGDQVFLVDTHEGTIAGIDPVTTDPLGELWLAPAGIVDATIDGQGMVWTLDSDGLVTELRWSATEQRFFEQDTRPVDHSGPGSLIVGHERGVTVFGPDEGIVVQIGTGHDVIADQPELTGQLAAPEYSPSTVVPVASRDTGQVFIVSDDRVWVSDVRNSPCAHPDQPEVFAQVIYVPCPGDDRVLRLRTDGSRAASDIPTPAGGQPELVVDDDNLVINVQGASQGVMVHGDGSVGTIIRYDDSVPPTQVSTTDDPPDAPSADEISDLADEDNGPAPVTPPPSQSPCDHREHCHDGGYGGHSGGPGGGDSHGSDPGSTSSDPISAPSGVQATALPDGSVRVSWNYSGTTPDRFVVSEVGGGSLARVSGRNRQADVSVATGPSHQFTVTAEREGDPSQTSQPSGPVATSGRPGAPTSVAGTANGSASDDSVSVSITWAAPPDNGSPITGYTVSATDNTGTHTIQATGTNASYVAHCGDGLPYCNPGSVNVSVVAHNANGAGAAGNASISFAGPFASPLPAEGTHVATGDHTVWDTVAYEGTGTTTLSLNPPPEWATFNGTCSWAHTDGGGGGGGAISCSASSVDVPINNGYDEAGGTYSHSVVFSATNRNGTAHSATYTWTTVARPCGRPCLM